MEHSKDYWDGWVDRAEFMADMLNNCVDIEKARKMAYRATGRTTKMLKEAKACPGEKYIVAKTVSMAEDYADGIDGALPIAFWSIETGMLRPLPMFFDHSCFE